MNILFAGTPQPSAKILEILSQDKDINIVGAITKADKAQKRGNKLEESPVSALCNKLNIKTFKPESLNSEEFKTEMLGIDFDFLVVAAYGKILPNWFLNCANIMSINVHYSLLPKYRGASPIQSSLLNGDAITGITFMKISEGLDEGEVIKQFELKINDAHNKVLLENDLCNLAGSKISKLLNEIKNNKFQLTEQDNGAATYCKKINKLDSRINFLESANEIFNKYRAYYEWPGLSFEHKNIIIKIKGMYIKDAINDKHTSKKYNLKRDGIYVKTHDSVIVITHLQFPNKNVISASDAFNAYKDFFEN